MSNEERENELFDRIFELEAEIQESNDSVTWWINRFNAVERDNRKLKEGNERLKKELNKHIKEGIEKDIIIDKAIKYIEEKADYPISYYHCLKELRTILQGSDKE